MGYSIFDGQSYARPSRVRIWIACLVVAGLAVFVLANTHLVYVAVTSQPDCMPHLKDVGTNGKFRAARSSC